MLISANLGFLFTDLPLARPGARGARRGLRRGRISRPARGTDLAALRAGLGGMPVMGVNTFMGPTMGRAALSRDGFARISRSAAQAAAALGARAIHIVAGMGGDIATYLHNLDHALARTPCPLVIEPISAPGYFLSGVAQAEAVLDHVNSRVCGSWPIGSTCAPGSEIDGPGALTRLWPRIGHVQLARAGDRGAPCPVTDPEIARVDGAFAGPALPGHRAGIPPRQDPDTPA